MRIIFDSILFISLFIVPWWASFIFALAGVFFFADFYEIVLAGFIVDMLYDGGNSAFFGTRFLSTLVGLLLFAGGSFIKKRLVFYP
ncbi:MAG: hypothetical protein HZC03_01845 [Candidatus Lloydbacteria bacterium]|nr:hypothetical protein [Candidatus Lloydbacteria bacterium]